MPEPTKIPRPFADSGDKNTIPESSGALGFASWQEGFPAITGTPFAQGGVAPKRADFNGIFYALSQAVMWMQQGGVYIYDVNTDYEAGNVVLDAGGLYVANSANGPSSVVVQPSTDTTGAAWKLVRLDLATPTAAGYMSGADKTKLDGLISTDATPTAAGYMSGADKTKLDGLISTDATPTAAGYMSAADKTGLDALTNPTSFMPTFTNNIDTTQNNSFYGLRLGRIIVFTYWLYLKNATHTWDGNHILTNMPHATGTYQFPSCNADNLFLDGYTTVKNDGSVYYVGRSVSVPAGKGIRGWGCYLAAD